MKKAYKLSLILLLLVALLCYCCAGCGDEPPEDPSYDDPGTSVVDPDKAHYLIFMVDGTEIAKMLVTEADTYESLEPYFPTIPEKDGYTSYWETVTVYDAKTENVYINAYYVNSSNS